jgi:hypothetical protein
MMVSPYRILEVKTDPPGVRSGELCEMISASFKAPLDARPPYKVDLLAYPPKHASATPYKAGWLALQDG